jgi:hypothetical protein
MIQQGKSKTRGFLKEIRMDMKKVALLMCIGLMGTGAFAYTLIGPPTAELVKEFKTVDGKDFISREDKHSYIFSYSQMDLDIGGVTVEDVELNRHYYSWGVALDENFNFSILLGAVAGQMDKEDIGADATSDFDGKYGFSWGFNVKSTFHHGEKVDWGATCQMTWFTTEDTINVTGVGPVEFEIDDAYDLQVAVGPTVDMGGWKLYGGAYFYMLNGDLELSTPALGWPITEDIEEDDEFGGFVGAQFNLFDSTDLIVEYAQGNDSYAVSTSIGWRF